MTNTSVVYARIDERTKKDADAAEKALPVEPLNPNAETISATKAARRGDLTKAGKPKDLLGSLNAGDRIYLSF